MVLQNIDSTNYIISIILIFIISTIIFKSKTTRLLTLILILNVGIITIYVMNIENGSTQLLSENVTISILIPQLILILISNIVIHSRVSKPLVELINHTNKLADGDLVTQINEKVHGLGESGELIKRNKVLSSRYKTIISNIKSSADQLSIASTNLASGSQEVAATTQEVTNTIQTIAEGAAEQVKRLDEVSRILTEMVQVTEESIRQIALTSRITLDLADQTNLVSLNAAIEAAKVSEIGEGFQVVAENVRTLSLESRSASSNVNIIIREISTRMRQSVERIVHAVNTIATVAENTAASSQEAAAAAEEQSSALLEITQQAQKLSELSISTEKNIAEFRLN
ncbi:MAG: methyl-accepting chemotaxis protein [Candidatus Heimdallarchaeota archaeon]|nr:methyl-accepting chemotaxis protein [Candidatus Heimdallarchaeota archaeon]MDH5646666.1 methyl-accepting chemotaxis protein [Candidatus Heimdallarchaeota archaeon]